MTEHPRPPVRAITLGVAEAHPLSGATLERAAAALKQATAGFTGAGWQVQTGRLSTRPLLADLRDWPVPAVAAYAAELGQTLDQLGVEFCSVGTTFPGDGPERAEAMADVVAGRPAINGSVLVATAQAGLDVPAAGAAARVMLRLAHETDQGLGNFNFAALACVGPGTPFFPAAYHAGPASLSVALQGAGIVADALRGGAPLEEVTARVAGA
ncbi:MAG: DUF711 family protein, partial [Acidimicrobiales bacterium]